MKAVLKTQNTSLAPLADYNQKEAKRIRSSFKLRVKGLREELSSLQARLKKQ